MSGNYGALCQNGVFFGPFSIQRSFNYIIIIFFIISSSSSSSDDLFYWPGGKYV